MTYKLVYLARRAATVKREDWPRTWKSHAIFASQFPALEAQIDWLRYCNRVDQPAIDGAPVDLPKLSLNHDGVAVAASKTLEGIKGGGFSPENQALIDTDELRVFDMLTPNFTFFTTETVVRPGPLGAAAVFQFIPSAKGQSGEEFAQHYGSVHSSRIQAALLDVPGLTRAVLNHPIGPSLPLFPFDGISETWFETADDAARALAGGGFDAQLADLADCANLDGVLTMLTTVCHRWSEP